MTGAYQIRAAIKACPRGSIFFPEDFSFIGGTKMVSSTLLRLCEDNTLTRVGQGIYCYPIIDTRWGLGAQNPSLEEIATAIAKRDKARIVPTGSYAMNKLGLSTQLQTNVVFYTDGSPRRIKIGNGRGILFKRCSEMKRFAFRSELMQLIVAAMREIGNGRINSDEIAKISELLKNVEQSDFIHDVALAPAWVQKILKEIR